MKNGSKKKKLVIVLLLLVVASGCYFVSGTYAKYTRALGGSDTATVAKFSVDASGLNKEQNATISLFDNVKEADTTSSEENVLEGKIAPGTGGSFTTTLTNKSEVDVKAVVTLKETANTSNVPIEYSLDKTNWKSASEITKEVNLDYVGKKSANSSSNVTIYWRWAFDGSDSTDTTLGEATTTPTVTTQVTATFTQID